MAGLTEATPSVMSEAAVFALVPHLGRVEAVDAVKTALADAVPLADLLREHLGEKAKDAAGHANGPELLTINCPHSSASRNSPQTGASTLPCQVQLSYAWVSPE